MNLYLKDKNGSLQRTENFPMASVAIGNYMTNIFYVPNDEFDRIMGELQISKTIPDPNDDTKVINNEVISLYKDSNVVHAFLRPDRWRDKDREDWKKTKEQKTKGILNDKLRKN